MSIQLRRRLHDQLHRLPGMPSHSEAERLHARRGPARAHHRPGFANRRHSPPGPPRVLVSWQEWIGRLVGHGR